jgi:putative membrane protein
VPSEPGDDGGVEPDYRFSLANERTFLAWVRTSLALLAGGIALEEVAPASLGDTTRRTLAVAALALSLMLAASSYVRWHQVQQAMRHGRPLPRPWAIPVLSTAVVAVAGAVAIVLLVR